MSRFIDKLPTPAVVREKKLIVTSKSRTGTFSLYQALKILGFKPYHMYEIVVDPTNTHQALYEEALRCKYFGGGKPYGKAEFDKWFADYDTIVEIAWPFLDELLAAYPQAKYLHTERDMDKWGVSLAATAIPIFTAARTLPLTAVSLVDPSIARFCSLHVLLERLWFHGKGGEAGIEVAKEDNVQFNKDVREKVPPRELLIVSLEDGLGWEEICPFLGKPIPDVAYPRGNAPAEFKALADQVLVPRIQRGMLILGSVVVVPLASIGAWYYLRRR